MRYVMYATIMVALLPSIPAECDSSAQVCTDTVTNKLHVACSTTAGPLLFKLLPKIAPHGVKRVQQLVENGFFGASESANGVAFHRNIPGFLLQFGQQSTKLMSKWDRLPLLDDHPARLPKITRGTLAFAGTGKNSRTTQIFIAYCHPGKCGKLGKQPWETPVGRLVGRASMATLYKLEHEVYHYGEADDEDGPDPKLIATDSHYGSKTESYLARNFPKMEYITGCSLLDADEAAAAITEGTGKSASEVEADIQTSEKLAQIAAENAEAALKAKEEAEEAARNARLEKYEREREALWEKLVVDYKEMGQPEFSEETTFRPDDCAVTSKVGDSLWLSMNATIASGTAKGNIFLSSSEQNPYKREVGDADMVVEGLRRALIGACIGEVRVITVPADVGFGAQGTKEFKDVRSGFGLVPPNAPLQFDVRVDRINVWDGTRHAPEAPADLSALPHYLHEIPEFCTLSVAAGDTNLACRLATFGPQKLDKRLRAGLWMAPTGSPGQEGCAGSLAAYHSDVAGNVLLLRRGGCPFFDKYLEAARYKAKAVIVADNQPLGEAGLIGLQRGPGVAEHAVEKESDAPICIAISKEDGDRLAKEIRAGLTLKKLPGMALYFNEMYHDKVRSHSLANQLRDEVSKRKHEQPSGQQFCGVVPRLALNLAISLARAKEFDTATSVFPSALQAADDCAALAEAGTAEVKEAEGKVGAGLNRTERVAGYNMLIGLYAEWGHVMHASRAAARARTIDPNASLNTETRVRCHTTKGAFEMSLFRSAAPIGFERFMDLVHKDFYNRSAFYRVTDAVAQWGFAATPKEQAQYARKNRKLDDDVDLSTPMERGVISFHGHGGKSRHTSVFIAKQYMAPARSDDLMRWGESDWVRGFGVVTRGMDVVDTIAQVGEVEQDGVRPDVKQGPNMLQVQLMGNKYIEQDFPEADYIETCTEVVDNSA